MKKYIILGIITLAVILGGGIFALFSASAAVRGKAYGGACRKQV
ncbi:MAG: hypothetical protein ACLUIQ_05325 [Dialister invisus]